MADLKLVVTQERLERVKLGVLRRTGSDDNLKQVVAYMDYIAHFMVNDKGAYLSRDEALSILDEYEQGDLEEIGTDLKQKAEEVAAPKA